jgi:transcriptional regulator with XRE-family HTH domain
MSTNNNILSLIEKMPDVILNNVAQRVKQRRLEAEFTQKELAQRAGIPLSTYRRFERTGEVAFRSLLMLGVALNMTDEFDTLFSQKIYKNIDDLLNTDGKKRQRGKAYGEN